MYFLLVIVTRQGAVLNVLGNNQLPGLKNKYYGLLRAAWETAKLTDHKSSPFSLFHQIQ